MVFRETLTFTDLLYNKEYDQPDEEIRRSGLEVSSVQELLSPGGWVAPPYWHVNVFTNTDTLLTLYFGDFYGGFIKSALTQSPVPLPFPEDGDWGKKVPSF